MAHAPGYYPSAAKGVQHRYLTFKRLVNSSKAELDAIFDRGIMPDIEDLEGWEFRGCNTPKLMRLLGIRKFKKGFYRDAETHPHELFGYNIPVEQNGTFDPHLSLPNESEPKRFGYYLVTPDRRPGPDDKHHHALMLDYGRGPNPPLEPAKVLRDFLVQPDPDNNDLFLGNAYIALGPARIFSNYFVLERYNHIGL